MKFTLITQVRRYMGVVLIGLAADIWPKTDRATLEWFSKIPLED